MGTSEIHVPHPTETVSPGFPRGDGETVSRDRESDDLPRLRNRCPTPTVTDPLHFDGTPPRPRPLPSTTVIRHRCCPPSLDLPKTLSDHRGSLCDTRPPPVRHPPSGRKGPHIYTGDLYWNGFVPLPPLTRSSPVRSGQKFLEYPDTSSPRLF